MLIAVATSLTFFVLNSENMDFVRFAAQMRKIYGTNMTLGEYLEGLLKNSTDAKKYNFVFYSLLFFIGKHSRNPYILAWICTFVDYAIVSYILYDWGKNRKYSLKKCIYIFIFCSAMLPFVHVVSGLRAAMASSVFCLATYNYVYKDKTIAGFIVGCLVAISIHTFVLLAIPIAMLAKIMPRFKVFVAVYGASLAMSYIATYLGTFGIPFFTAIATKYRTYTGSQQFRAYRSFYYGTIIICAILVLYYFFFIWSYKKNNTKVDCQKNKIYVFIVGFAGLILGNTNGYELVCRNAYILGIFAPIVVGMLFDGIIDKNSKAIVAKILRVMIFVLSVYILQRHFRFYGGHFSLNNIIKSLHGANYYY